MSLGLERYKLNKNAELIENELKKLLSDQLVYHIYTYENWLDNKKASIVFENTNNKTLDLDRLNNRYNIISITSYPEVNETWVFVEKRGEI